MNIHDKIEKINWRRKNINLSKIHIPKFHKSEEAINILYNLYILSINPDEYSLNNISPHFIRYIAEYWTYFGTLKYFASVRVIKYYRIAAHKGDGISILRLVNIYWDTNKFILMKTYLTMLIKIKEFKKIAIEKINKYLYQYVDLQYAELHYDVLNENNSNIYIDVRPSICYL